MTKFFEYARMALATAPSLVAGLAAACAPPLRSSIYGQFDLQYTTVNVVVPAGQYNAWDVLVKVPSSKRLMMGPSANNVANPYRNGLAISFSPTGLQNRQANPYVENGQERWVSLYNSQAPTLTILEGTILEFPVAINQFYMHVLGNVNTGITYTFTWITLPDGFKIHWRTAVNTTG